MSERIIEEAERWVKDRLGGDSSGHDWHHIHRVVRLAERIGAAEGADLRICRLAAWLHDMADAKLVRDEAAAQAEVRVWLLQRGISDMDIRHVVDIISTLSFKGSGGTSMATLEGKVVQDADRLDALGAIGIARTFAYSGWKGRPMHDPDKLPRTAMTEAEYRSGNDTAINHFYEKLFRLKTLLNTESAKAIAESRHQYMESFIEQFKAEWDGLR